MAHGSCIRVSLVPALYTLFELSIVLDVVALATDMIWGERLVIIGSPGIYNHEGVQAVPQSAPLAKLG